MKAVRYHRPKSVKVEDVPEPRLEHPRDAVIRVTSTAICGSDLHIYNGLLPDVKPFTIGHEFMGVVEELGEDVDNLQEGDRVVVPFPISCGRCYFCTRGMTPHCENSNANYGPEGGLMTEKGAALFGYTHLYGGYDGGQAEKARVPYADFGPRKVPENLRDEEVLFLTDIFCTGYTAAKWGGVSEGDTVAVFGCGPVGIMAMKSAKLMGADTVIGVDREDYRMRIARETTGGLTVNTDEQDAIEFIREQTDDRGADVVIDAVGMEAHRNILQKAANIVHVQRGTLEVLKDSVSAVRRGGVVSIVGVYGTPMDNFPIGQMFDKGVEVKMGQAPVHSVIDECLAHIVEGRVRTDDIITHTFPLEEAPHAYDIFNGKEENCLKVVLKP